MTAAERAAGLATRWVDYYTRRLPARVAQARLDELASDMWEQRHDAQGVGTLDVAVALSIVRRVVAGVPADLSWRFAQLMSVQGRVAGGPALRGEGVMTMSQASRVWVRQHVRTRKCKGCGVRYARKYAYCPVCKAWKGSDGTPPAGASNPEAFVRNSGLWG